MPIYDCQCTSCKAVKRDVVHASSEPPPTCECGAPTEHVWLGRGAPAAHIFHEGMYEHLAYDPLYFSSKRKLKDYCKQHDLVMDYLE